jgi:phosphoglycolate phosphatase
LKYRLAIFDLDGTILDTLDDLCTSVNHALKLCGYPCRNRQEVRRFLGNGARVLITKSVPAGTADEDIDHTLTLFSSHYGEHCNDVTAPYAGIPELFDVLRNNGIKVAVVSNKPDFAVQILCRQHFPDKLDAVTGERADVRKKPAPDSVNDVMSKLGIAAADAVYIGDSEVDIETAANADIPCISVDWGFRDKDFLEAVGASVIASTMEELQKLLLA